MKIIVFGATGRVGACIVEQAVAAGHDVTAFVRPGKAVPRSPDVVRCEGDVTDPAAVAAAVGRGYDAAVNAVGPPALVPSTVVADSVRSILAAMEANGVERYLGVSGTAEMSPKTRLGALTMAFFRRTPVGHPIRDHDAAYALLAASPVRWTLTGCGYIADGPRRETYETRLELTGGFKQIHPGDVADFIVRELAAPTPAYARRVVGLWY